MNPENVQKPQKRRRRAPRGQSQRKRLRHVGLHARRTRNNPVEAAIAEKWFKDNDPDSSRGFNEGMGRLQDLMVVYPPGEAGLPSSPFSNRRVVFWITQREATIVATVMQWLGSPVGREWLFDILRKCGYEIQQVKKSKEIPPIQRSTGGNP